MGGWIQIFLEKKKAGGGEGGGVEGWRWCVCACVCACARVCVYMRAWCVQMALIYVL